MKVELEREEVSELLTVILDRILAEASLSDADHAALKRWRSTAMRAGSEGMIDLTVRVNADIERTLQTRARSHVRRPDWR